MDAVVVAAEGTFGKHHDGPVTDSFYVCSLDGLVLLKLIGFVEREQARVLDIDEQSARLRIGQTWWERLWNGGPASRAVEVRLAFTPETPEESAVHRQRAPHSRVDVELIPAAGRADESFRSCANALLRRLRWHFLVTG